MVVAHKRHKASSRIKTLKWLLLQLLVVAIILLQKPWTLLHSDTAAGARAEPSPPENSAYPYALEGATPNLAAADLPAFAQQLWDKYQQRLKGPHASNATIVYKCVPGWGGCGGWGDRLRGMATLFYYALLTDSQFSIINTKPMDLEQAYPLVAELRPQYSEEGASQEAWQDRDNLPWLTEDIRASVGRNRVLVRRCNGYAWYYFRHNPHLADITAFYGLDKLTAFDMFRVMMQLYFSRLSPDLQALVDEQMAQMTVGGARPFRVGVQVRFGSSWGDRQRYPADMPQQMADQALLDCKRAPKNTKCWIYVTSDHEPSQAAFVQRVRQQEPEVHVTGATGTPVHVDMSAIAASDNSALLKSYVDWEVLRRMDHLVISRSGFGETAAWVSMIPAERMSMQQSECDLQLIGGAFCSNQTFYNYDSIVGPPPGVHP